MGEGIHISLKGEQVIDLFGLPITNTLLMSWLTMFVLVVVAVVVGGSLKRVPGRLQVLFESMIGSMLSYMEETLEDKNLARKLLPFIATLFMFILLGNWLGLIPGVGSIVVHQPASSEARSVALEESAYDLLTVGSAGGAEAVEPTSHDAHASGDKGHSVALLHPMSTDLNITLALAIMSFLVIEVLGVMYHGALKYGSKFVNFRSGIGFFVGIIDLFSELARLISFSFRLFGNMFAGKTLILVAMFFVPLLLPVPLMLYEVMVGFVQAAVFSLLTLFFVKIAVAEMDHH